jgi:imidazolonepropionase-like amidohydrolase
MQIKWILFLILSWLWINPCLASKSTVVLHGGTVIPAPDAQPIANGVIVIKDSVITAVSPESDIEIPRSADLIDLSGKFVFAGFWNSHVHYLLAPEDVLPANREKLQQHLTNTFLKWGFVNTVDTGSDIAITNKIIALIEDGQVIGPEILKMSGSFVPKGGSPFYIAPVKLPELTGAAQASKLTNQWLDLDIDGIKLFTGSWATVDQVVLMEPDHVRAATDAAHNKNKLVFAHPSDSDGARIAIEGGVDVLAHTFPAEIKGPWDKSLPGKMVERGMALVPTLKLFRYDLQRIGLAPAIIDRLEQNAVDQLSAFQEEGGTILFGTDVGYMADADTTEEYRLMEKAGLQFEEVLTSLTTAPASIYGLSQQQGQIKPGWVATIVALEDDPRENIEAFANVFMAFKDGRIVYEK